MKITKEYLKRVIKEELGRINEAVKPGVNMVTPLHLAGSLSKENGEKLLQLAKKYGIGGNAAMWIESDGNTVNLYRMGMTQSDVTNNYYEKKIYPSQSFKQDNKFKIPLELNASDIGPGIVIGH